MTETILVAGAGHAAGQTIVSLRQGGYAGQREPDAGGQSCKHRRIPHEVQFYSAGSQRNEHVG